MSENLCIQEGCTKPVHVKKRGLCNTHYQLWTKHNKPNGAKPCGLDDCDGILYARNYCQKHYEKLRKYGDAAYQPVYMYQRKCILCDRQAKSREMCHTHYMLWWMENAELSFNPDHHNYKDVVGYAGAHYRVRRIKGKADRYECLDCGGSASDWALKHNPSSVLIEEGNNPRTNGAMYSLNVDDYEPRCSDCHKAYDAKFDNRKAKPGPKKVQS